MAFKKKDSFEFKDRIYIYKGKGSPASYSLNLHHKNSSPLQYFDAIKKINRTIRYATNQQSPFEDEQEGYVSLGKAVFIDGKLTVKKEDVVLQKILSIYHPYKDVKYYEFDGAKDAEEELEKMDLVFDAQKIIRELPIEDLEAIGRVLWHSKVNTLTSKELKRDMLIYAKSKPKEIIDLSNDEDIKLRNLAVRAVETGILKIHNDGRTFSYTGKNGKKVLDVEFGKNAYSELASFFKTDDGILVMQNIISKI